MWFVVWTALGQVAAASDFHFSALGNDTTGDGSLANPWRSITKLNALDLNAGDQVLFRAGDTFAGNIILQASDSATNAAGIFGGSPLTFSSYGSGARPIISSPTGHGLRATDVGGLNILGLEFAGASSLSAITPTSNTRVGLLVENAQSTFRQQHVYLDDVVVHGFGEAGIQLLARNPTINSGGFDDVRITNSTIYDNGRSGIVSGVTSTSGLVTGGTAYDYHSRAHANVHVANNRVYGMTGKNEASGVSGNGVVLAQVDGAVIERNVAHHNGGLAGGGGVGIWTWESNNVAIQFNEAYQNQTFDGRDGGGFDLDGGVTNSVMQYNYSHGNEGAGLGLFQFGYASKMGGNAIRYNISESDGAGISVWGNGPRFPGQDLAEDSLFYNNTVIQPNGPAVHYFGSVDDVGVYNNILMSKNGNPLVKLDDWDGAGSNYNIDVQMTGNAYWASDSLAAIQWGNASFNSVTAWSNATAHESIAGSFAGILADPQLVGPFVGGTILNDADLLEALTAYRLRSTSPLVDAGRSLDEFALAVALGLTDREIRDFFGGNIPSLTGFDVGAHELPFRGDFNNDGRVDAADYTVWRDGLGTTYTPADFDTWRANFNAAADGGASAGGESVPEPGSSVLVALGAVILGVNGRRSLKTVFAGG